MKKVYLPSVLLSLCLFGCSVPSPTHVATTTVSFAGSVAKKTTVTAVKTSTHIAVATTRTALHGSGAIAKTVISAPMIIFKDTTTGIIKHVPYSEGLRLYAASQTAQFEAGLKTFQLVRNGTPVMTSMWSKIKAGTPSDPILHAGDVIHITSVQKVKGIAKRI